MPRRQRDDKGPTPTSLRPSPEILRQASTNFALPLEESHVGLYEERILPHLVNLAMRNRRLIPYRERLISMAEGRVLEIGVGSGLNLPFYPPRAREILGLEPAPRLLAMSRRLATRLSLPVKFIEGSAETIPLEDHSIDTVVTTWTFRTIPRGIQALTE